MLRFMAVNRHTGFPDFEMELSNSYPQVNEFSEQGFVSCENREELKTEFEMESEGLVQL